MHTYNNILKKLRGSWPPSPIVAQSLNIARKLELWWDPIPKKKNENNTEVGRLRYIYLYIYTHTHVCVCIKA